MRRSALWYLICRRRTAKNCRHAPVSDQDRSGKKARRPPPSHRRIREWRNIAECALLSRAAFLPWRVGVAADPRARRLLRRPLPGGQVAAERKELSAVMCVRA
ncbi:hypothetical protein DWUX_125 [Desulfovibrio diazotrophicus]|nr:hypothetical protein DWUX_125 [Desulfovibrio diazotrophicus]